MRHTRRTPRRRPEVPGAGFTLIEVVAAIFLTSIVLTVAIGFFVNLSHSTEAATSLTREGRHALAVLDRVARDLEGAYLLVKPEEMDPLLHPWLFLAESEFGFDGADRVKFVTRNHRPRNSRDHGSDLAVVTYLLRTADEGPGLELVRAISPGLPEALDREFLSDDDELFMRVATGVDRFAMRFLNDEPEWQENWDSSLIGDSSALPEAVEIDLRFGSFDSSGEVSERDAFEAFATLDEEDDPFQRLVVLPLKAIDLVAMLHDAENEANNNDEDDERDEDDEDGEGNDRDADGNSGDHGEPDDRTAAECIGMGRRADIIRNLGEEFLTRRLSDPAVRAALERYGIDCP